MWLQSASRQVPRHVQPGWAVWTLPFRLAHYDRCFPESSRYAWQPLHRDIAELVLAMLQGSSVSCTVRATLLVHTCGDC